MEQQTYTEFLPISRADMEARGWDQLDFVVVGGDAYVDHPSFGTAIISRLLEAEGYKVGVLAQPRYTDCEDFKRFGKPKYGFFIGGGNVDSMVSHYSVAKIPRAEDEYSPGGKGGARPDRSATVYTKLAKEAYPDLPVILGGLEASLRRFAHYDYWMDTVLPSIAESSGADIISFGMGEHQTVEIARRLAAGEPVEQITDVDGTCYLTDFDHLPEKYVECAGFKKVASDKTAYAKACRIQMDNQDVVSGQIIVQKQSEKYLVQNIPAKPLVRGELDKVYALPYTRRYHPIYESMGGVPAIREVQFSIIQNRGCFGGCNFCAIQLHQGRRVTSRSADSIVEEAERMTHEPDFKGYIHDVGGPTANFRFPSCREQMLRGIVKVTVVASEPLPAPLELSFNYYWTSVYTDDPYSPERHSDTYTLSLKAGARGTSQYLFDAGREMLRQPIYHIDGYYTRDGFMVVEGGGMTVTSVSEPPSGYTYNVLAPEVRYRGPGF